MDPTTLVAGIAVGVALALGGPGVWRWRTQDDLIALLRSTFALLVAIVAVSGAVAVVGPAPEVQSAAARIRGTTVLVGVPVLLRLLGAGVDLVPPRWLQAVAVGIAATSVPLIWLTDLYVTGAIVAPGTPEPGPLFVALSTPPVVLTVGWTVVVCSATDRTFDRWLLAIGIGLPSLGSVLLLTDPAGRDALWVAALTPLLVVVEVTRWRTARRERARSNATAASRARLTGRLHEANAELRDAVRARTRLLDAVGHELRTPVTVMLGFIEVLQRHPDLPPASRAEYLATIERNTRRLHEALEQLVTASTAATPDQPLQITDVGVGASVAAAVARTVPSTTRVVVSCPGDQTVAVDPFDLDVILDALLDNASRHGRPPVRVSTRHADEGSLELRVADDGPGVPGELRPHVFEPFVQASSGDTRQTGGVGLGLYNAAQLARRNHGELLLADDSPASFLLRLPVPATGGPPSDGVAAAH